MPFRSVKFGDSIINMKSVLTAQSPWWYQLKTASFRVGTCHAAAFFLFSPFFLFKANLFHGPATTTHLCHAPAPGHDFLGQQGNTSLSTRAAQFAHTVAGPPSARSERWDLSAISPRGIMHAWRVSPVLPLAEGPVVTLLCWCSGSGLALQIV